MNTRIGRPTSKTVVLVVGLALADAAIGFLDFVTHGAQPIAHLHYLPIIVAAAYFGYTGALAATASSVLWYHLAHFVLHGRPVDLTEADLLRIALFVIVGLSTAHLASDRRRLAAYTRRLEQQAGELAAANERLSRVSDEKSRLVAITSHEVKTPLSVIVAYTQLLLQAEADPVSRRRLQNVLGASRQLLHTVNNLLDLSRVEARRFQISPVVVDVVSVAAECLDLYGGLFKQHPLTLVGTDSVALALADRERLEQVLVNLLTNAAKYSPPNAPITVRVTAGDEFVSLEVADEGPGIEPAEREHIFEAFYRIDGAEADGTGLGLAICREIVTAHGGQIGVRGSDEGRGSVFFFTLPAALTGVRQIPETSGSTVVRSAGPERPVSDLVEHESEGLPSQPSRVAI